MAREVPDYRSVLGVGKTYQTSAVPFLFPIADVITGETGGRTLADYEALLGSDQERPIVVYCGFVKCTRSQMARPGP